MWHFKQWFGGRTQHPIEFLLVFLVVFADLARERFTVLTLKGFAMNLNSRLALVVKSVILNAFLLKAVHCGAHRPHVFKELTQAYAFAACDTFQTSHVSSAQSS